MFDRIFIHLVGIEASDQICECSNSANETPMPEIATNQLEAITLHNRKLMQTTWDIKQVVVRFAALPVEEASWPITHVAMKGSCFGGITLVLGVIGVISDSQHILWGQCYSNCLTQHLDIAQVGRQYIRLSQTPDRVKLSASNHVFWGYRLLCVLCFQNTVTWLCRYCQKGLTALHKLCELISLW